MIFLNGVHVCISYFQSSCRSYVPYSLKHSWSTLTLVDTCPGNILPSWSTLYLVDTFTDNMRDIFVKKTVNSLAHILTFIQLHTCTQALLNPRIHTIVYTPVNSTTTLLTTTAASGAALHLPPTQNMEQVSTS